MQESACWLEKNCIAIGKLVVEPLYCNTWIVLQLWCSWMENCIAIWWCSGLKIVLQYRGVQWKNCIAILVLYCDLKGLKGCFCIAIHMVYCG